MGLNYFPKVSFSKALFSLVVATLALVALLTFVLCIRDKRVVDHEKMAATQKQAPVFLYGQQKRWFTPDRQKKPSGSFEEANNRPGSKMNSAQFREIYLAPGTPSHALENSDGGLSCVNSNQVDQGCEHGLLIDQIYSEDRRDPSQSLRSGGLGYDITEQKNHALRELRNQAIALEKILCPNSGAHFDISPLQQRFHSQKSSFTSPTMNIPIETEQNAPHFEARSGKAFPSGDFRYGFMPNSRILDDILVDQDKLLEAMPFSNQEGQNDCGQESNLLSNLSNHSPSLLRQSSPALFRDELSVQNQQAPIFRDLSEEQENRLFSEFQKQNARVLRDLDQSDSHALLEGSFILAQSNTKQGRQQPLEDSLGGTHISTLGVENQLQEQAQEFCEPVSERLVQNAANLPLPLRNGRSRLSIFTVQDARSDDEEDNSIYESCPGSIQARLDDE